MPVCFRNFNLKFVSALLSAVTRKNVSPRCFHSPSTATLDIHTRCICEDLHWRHTAPPGSRHPRFGQRVRKCFRGARQPDVPPSHPNTRPARCRRCRHLTSPMPKAERSQTAAWCCPAPCAFRSQQSAPPVPCPTPDLPVTRSGRRGDPSTRGGRRKAPPRTPLPTCCHLCAKTATRMRAAACTGAESRAPMQRARPAALRS